MIYNEYKIIAKIQYMICNTGLFVNIRAIAKKNKQTPNIKNRDPVIEMNNYKLKF